MGVRGGQLAIYLISKVNKYMLLAGWEIHIVKNCDLGRKPRAAFSSPRSQFFTIRTDPKPDNNLFIFSCGKFFKWVCLYNFVIELAYAPSTNHS